MTRHGVIVSHAGSGEVRVFHLDPGGALTEVQNLTLGGQLMPMAVSPDRSRLYVARRSAPLAVVTLAIAPEDCRLTRLAEVPLPSSMANLATDRTGRWLLSASYPGHIVAVGPIDADGVAQAVQQVLPTPPNAHAIHTDPSNRCVFATSLGGGVVLQYRFDESRGELRPAATPSIAPHAGASPRHLVFDAEARFVYLLNELDAMVDVLAFDAAAGTLRTVQTIASLPPQATEATAAPWAADLHLAPDGRSLYSSDRRSSTLTVFDVDPTTGLLALRGRVPTEAEPRGFAITPDGRHLIAAGQASNRLAVSALDSAGGLPRLLGTVTTGEGPNWIEVLALPA